MISSPLRYPGGKSKALKFIVPLIPNFEEYREPFLGGGSVFIYLKQVYSNSNKLFWINDIYDKLYLFWNFLKENPNDLINQIQYFKDNFYDGKLLYRYLINNIDKFEDLNKAAAFFVLNRITFSGTIESGGVSISAFNKRFTQSSIERVRLLSNILDDSVIITNLDYEYVIKKKGNNVFIFLDPPYYSATKSALYGKKGILHKTFDHERLSCLLKNTSHKWLLTYDNSEYIKKLYSFAYIKEWDLIYGMRNVGKSSNLIGNELFISNFELTPKYIQSKISLLGQTNN
jgi:DNA adenine methylase